MTGSANAHGFAKTPDLTTQPLAAPRAQPELFWGIAQSSPERVMTGWLMRDLADQTPGCIVSLTRLRKSEKNRRATTLVELLVAMGVVAILSVMVVAAIRGVRENARRLKCASNLSQLGKAAIAHAQKHPEGAYIPSADNSDDSLGWLFPQFFNNLEVAICPSTNNIVRPEPFFGNSQQWYNRPDVPRDLHDSAAGGPTDDSGGHSYEVFSYYSRGNWVFNAGVATINYQRTSIYTQPNTDHNIERGFPIQGQPGYLNRSIGGDNVLKNLRLPFSMESKQILILDGDRDTDNPAAKVYSNYPDAGNNHGADGLNASFLDGHAEWKPAGPEIIEMYYDSFLTPGLPGMAMYNLFDGEDGGKVRIQQQGSANGVPNWIFIGPRK